MNGCNIFNLFILFYHFFFFFIFKPSKNQSIDQFLNKKKMLKNFFDAQFRFEKAQKNVFKIKLYLDHTN